MKQRFRNFIFLSHFGSNVVAFTCDQVSCTASLHIESILIIINSASEPTRWFIDRTRCSKGHTFSPTSSNSILTASQHGCISKVTINMPSKLQQPLHPPHSNSIITELLPTTTQMLPRLFRITVKTHSWRTYQRTIERPLSGSRSC